MNPTELIFIRHGETIWNLEKRWQGHLDSPLTPAGLMHGRAVAERLASLSFDALYSSDLPRARRMAEDISARTGKPIIHEPSYRERQYGVFEGRTMDDIRELFPQAHADYVARKPGFSIPESESVEAKHERISQAMGTTAQRHPGQRIVIVTHGGVIDSVFRIAVGLSLQFPRQWTLYNGSLNAVLFQDEKWMLGSWGDISHLSRTATPDYY